jgi:acetaldehyde dehydrogenase (acetylating)
MVRKRIPRGLIGPGDIGTPLPLERRRAVVLEPVWGVGIDAISEGPTP